MKIIIGNLSFTVSDETKQQAIIDIITEPTITVGSPDDADKNGYYPGLTVTYPLLTGCPIDHMKVLDVDRENGTVTIGPVNAPFSNPRKKKDK